MIRPQAGRTGFVWSPISAIASGGSLAASRSTKTTSNSPVSAKRRCSSRTMLVFPIRRCAVRRVWVPSRTRSSSASSSFSRSKKFSPSTQLLPPFRITPVFQQFCWQRYCCQQNCCQALKSTGFCSSNGIWQMPTVESDLQFRIFSESFAKKRNHDEFEHISTRHRPVAALTKLKPTRTSGQTFAWREWTLNCGFPKTRLRAIDILAQIREGGEGLIRVEIDVQVSCRTHHSLGNA